MINNILDGKTLSNYILYNIYKKNQKYKKFGYRLPSLAVILIGNNKSSLLYVKKKHIACKITGLISYAYNLSYSVNNKLLFNLINKLNNNNNIDGIIIQLPLPLHINTNKILELISIEKDVDGFNPYNIGKLCQRIPLLRPCTSLGIITLLSKYKINIIGLNALIIGASNIVGRPISMELLLSGCTITIVHRFTRNLNYYIKKSDLIIVSVGKINFISGKLVKYGVIIIDVGINYSSNGNIKGDVNFFSTSIKSSYITPVPGGVGPMTISALIYNTLITYKKKNKFII
ncbi:bifunctional methylenetetrahydrofolate dehydrogenase/methenyltetrahydrofolate cyclohydrolase FolD [Candidatus Annandia pinicola]|uniref:bifunctional methylenetetrahydrofolate dehydrogenase/methenyltetrahydrofolate cyclohydrolase FolD n=1 Tax=Candidatus Annandia pinicola TaxID=1345117 RepID=UPI001D00354D|nr:bifunctional methylenetetrahydrofolate dehydrogenase/methenyltetrahydrofolate cyclohydrolase FolD [Candidatus Annandia pinicola]UDG80336.1 Bifunctional protein FolD protein [Candidatus Annandia pinicola]